MKNKRCVAILSGGMDSGVMVAALNRDGMKIHALTFDYGSKHNPREIPCAKKLAKKYCVSHRVVKLDFIGKCFKSKLLKGQGKVPEGHYEHKSMKQTVVPYRNGIMLSIAVGYAESLGIKQVFYGNHAGDHAIYPDCRDSFVKAVSRAAQLGTYAGVEISSPFCHMNKRDIGLLGKLMKFDFSKTWTCYKGLKKHCGKCGSCTERREALHGFDTTVYD